MIQTTPVILCGGSGTRLWPLSRAGFPKQFLSLTGNESLFQQAAQRLDALGADDIQVAKPLIVTGEEHRFLASEQLREVGIELGVALLEPVGRNTAPALQVGQTVVRIDPRYFRPTEVETLLGDPSKAKQKLGWRPEITVQHMCAEMVAADLQVAKQHALLKANGYSVSVSIE
jgi:nucleoside-diphosphate-sugar epimerase